MRFQGYRSLFWFGFQEIPYEGEEVVLVSVAVADPLGHLDLVVEPLQPAGGDVVWECQALFPRGIRLLLCLRIVPDVSAGTNRHQVKNI